MTDVTEKFVWSGEIPVPARLIQYIDEGVRQSLPPGTVCHGISQSGGSYWAQTAKIDATGSEGQETAFFIKVHQFEHGKNMASSEFEAMKTLYNVMPEMVVEPVAWGAYVEEPDTYFFVCRFYDLMLGDSNRGDTDKKSNKIPDVSVFPALVAELHKRGESKTREFGFPLTTYGGRLGTVFDAEEKTQGPDEELTRLREGIMTKVIPRLLRPLETEGRTLTARLVHGDLWDGNASVDVNTGRPVIFDPTTLYAHNEYEMAPWWLPRHKMTGAYISEYIKHFQVSEPAEDFKDRGALYGLRFDLHSSSLYPRFLMFRETAMETMRNLLMKYLHGYEGYRLEKGISTSEKIVSPSD
ncbi:hypothetical protein QBC46DRAFT_461873 [Diplogelasinospora grovesii]|uniref:protein-ribulosamine 3-kinase n=1 Tax=Diplogelasinospora grovesii TaxID=303347 RepID=A0AAN6S0D0_9PEZI|nr:hypothetical protein QBC46DRAFT_461873 [Diplogelasinospora grovesii]